MPVDKFGRMSELKLGIPGYRLLIIIIIIFVVMVVLPFLVL